MLARIFLVFALVCLSVVGVVISGALFGGPPLEVTAAAGSATVDPQFLGEYCIGISSVKLTGPHSDTVWAASTEGPGYSGLCTFELKIGQNPVVPDNVDNLRVLVPSGADTFNLVAADAFLARLAPLAGLG